MQHAAIQGSCSNKLRKRQSRAQGDGVAVQSSFSAMLQKRPKGAERKVQSRRATFKRQQSCGSRGCKIGGSGRIQRSFVSSSFIRVIENSNNKFLFICAILRITHCLLEFY